MMNGQPQSNGNGPHANGLLPHGQHNGGYRAPTVSEALPYTPFASITPFNPGRSTPRSLPRP